VPALRDASLVETQMLWLEILILLSMILLNGYFAMAELAVVSARPARLEAPCTAPRLASGG
jgi:hypothetical protein